MRYIQKVSTPQFFIDNTAEISKWKEYPVSKKPLKEHILKNEQNYLCIYCESKVELNNSHLEHIKPKAGDKFPHLVFDYNNIVVSCNGNCHADDEEHHSCGHIKDNEYNDTKFLNPVELIKIRDYFEYDIDTGNITESPKDIDKAKYMIETLHLNDGSLPLARKKSLENFIKKMNQIDKNKRKNRLIEILNKENIAFVSFLRFKYKGIL
ncbi:retron system putative HNH endonuclease [Sulfurimonas sp. ST-27]|uniref:retron system putative HNH endonuclease n=1 Tax=Sulfurimonas sp. ST-27 TaxID=3400152 RepID=UPI003AB29410